MKPIYLILISVLLGAIGQVTIKWGTMSVTRSEEGLKSLLPYLTSIPILLGLFLYGLSALVWILAVAKVELSYAYPMVALGYVVVFLFSYFIFRETVTLIKVSGLLFILLGVFLISRAGN